MPNAADMAQSRGDIMREIEDLKRQIRELRAERRLESATIGGGGITVQGGAIRAVDENGTLVAVLGDLAEVLGPDQQGFWLGRPGPEPSMAISVYGTGTGGDGGFVGIWDRDGTYIITDDAESGRGMARPYLAVQMGETSAPTVTTTSGSFTPVAFGMGPLHHPVLYAMVLVRSDNGATTGEVRITLNSNAVGPTISVAGSEFDYKFIGPFAVPDPPLYHQINIFGVEARRTAGAGNIGVRVISMLGVESAFV